MLIDCYECGKRISDSVEHCPYCGYNIKEGKEKLSHFVLTPEMKKILIDESISNTEKFKYLSEKGVPEMTAKYLIFYGSVCSSKENIEEFKKIREKQERQAQQQANAPKCPTCGSTNLSKISGMKKAAKIGFFGIFGAGDLGKTWKCNNCGSKF